MSLCVGGVVPEPYSDTPSHHYSEEESDQHSHTDTEVSHATHWYHWLDFAEYLYTEYCNAILGLMNRYEGMFSVRVCVCVRARVCVYSGV